MKKDWLVKTLALGVVVLFIGVSCSSAISVDTKTSKSSSIDSDKENPNKNILNGPDLKIEKVYLTYGEKGHMWVWFITCDVTNIGEPIVDGKLEYYSEVWRWNYLTQTEESWGWVRGSSWSIDWDSNKTKGIQGIWETKYRNGLYRIAFSISTPGDVNPENDDFNGYFHIKNDCIYPSNPFDAPPEKGKIDVLLQTLREKVTNNMLLLKLLERFPLLQKLLLLIK